MLFNILQSVIVLFTIIKMTPKIILLQKQVFFESIPHVWRVIHIYSCSRGDFESYDCVYSDIQMNI